MRKNPNTVLPFDVPGLSFYVKDKNGQDLYRVYTDPQFLNFLIDEWAYVTNKRTGESEWKWKQLPVYHQSLLRTLIWIERKLVAKDEDISELKDVVASVKQVEKQLGKSVGDIAKQVVRHDT